MRNFIGASMLAVALGVAPAIARAAPEALSARGEARLYGLPIVTSDGVQVGAVTETGTDGGGYTVLLAELAGPLSAGTQTVAIPLELIVLKADRVDLLLTAKEVRDRLAGADDDRARSSAGAGTHAAPHKQPN